MAKSLETDSFINALRRFIARRGPPSDIYSDNGNNFIEADRELKQSLEQWNQSQIADYLSQKDIQWHFNPPALQSSCFPPLWWDLGTIGSVMQEISQSGTSWSSSKG